MQFIMKTLYMKPIYLLMVLTMMMGFYIYCM